ncbi:cation-transporting P-type ATPase [Hymenobacter sp. B81]
MLISTPLAQVLQELAIDPVTGLSEPEAAARLTRHGPSQRKPFFSCCWPS